MRLAGVQVDDCPNFLALAPSNSHQPLSFPDDGIRYHLALDGIFSYFPCHKPKGDDISNP